MLSSANLDPGSQRGDQMAQLAMEYGLMDRQTAHAIGGLQVMHDLALMAPGEPDNPRRAEEYAALVAGTLYAMDETARAKERAAEARNPRPSAG